MKAERNAKQKTKFFVFIAEAHPILGEAKDSANRAEYETKDEVFCFYSRGAAYLRHAVAKIVQTEDKAKQKTVTMYKKTNTNHTNYTNDAQYLFV